MSRITSMNLHLQKMPYNTVLTIKINGLKYEAQRTLLSWKILIIPSKAEIDAVLI